MNVTAAILVLPTELRAKAIGVAIPFHEYIGKSKPR
jgi:hypothetical protein